MNNLGEVIIALINFVGFLLYLFGALLTSWEGLGIILLVLSYIFSKGYFHFSDGILFLIGWVGLGYLLGVSNTIFSSLVAKAMFIGVLAVIFVVSKEVALGKFISK